MTCAKNSRSRLPTDLYGRSKNITRIPLQSQYTLVCRVLMGLIFLFIAASAMAAQRQVVDARDIQTRQIFKQAFEALGSVPDSSDKDQLCRRIAEGQANARDIEGALASATAIQDSAVKAHAVEAIAITQANHGNIVGALKTSPINRASSASLIRAISMAQAAIGNVASALTTAKVLSGMPEYPSLLCDIADLRARKADPVSALMVRRVAMDSVDQIQGPAKDNALQGLAFDLAFTGNITEALQTAWTVQNPDLRARTLAYIAKVQITANAKASARATLHGGLQVAGQIKEREIRISALMEFPPLLFKVGERSAAHRVIDLLTHDIAGINGVGAHAYYTDRLVLAQATMGDIQGALHTAASGFVLLAGEFGPEALSGRERYFDVIVYACGATVNLRGAKQALKSIPVHFPKTRLRALINIAWMEWWTHGRKAAIRSLQQAFGLAEQIQTDLKGDTLLRLIEAQAECRDVPGALKTLYLLSGADVSTGALSTLSQIALPMGDPILTTSALGSIAEAQFRSGDKAGCAHSLHRIAWVIEAAKPGWFPKIPSLRANDLTTIARAQTRAGNIKGVGEWAASFHSNYPKAQVLTGMAEGLL